MMRFKTIGLSLLVLLALGFQAGCFFEHMGLLKETDTIVSSPPPDGCLGEYYVYDLNRYFRVSNAAVGLEFTIASGTWPRGLELDRATGVISGIPEETGAFNFNIVVYDTTPARGQMQSESFTIQINRFSIITASLPPVCAGMSYNGALAICGGTPPFTWTITDTVPSPSPFPLHFSSAGPTAERGNTLTGTPTTDEVYTFTVRVTDSSAPAGSASRQFTLAVSDSLRITSSHYLPIGVFGQPYGPVTLAACGGSGDSEYIWEVDRDSSSDMPPGLMLASNGVISGTPARSGIYTPVLSVRRSVNAVTQNFVFQIADSPIATRPIPFPLRECVEIRGIPIVITGGLGERFWQLAPGQTMPPGLDVNTRGEVSGMPNTPGLFPVVFHVFDVLSGPTNPSVVTVNFDVAAYPPDSGFTIERIRQFNPTDPEYGPEIMNKIFLEIPNSVVVEWLFTDPAWGERWYGSTRKLARLTIIGNCGAEITAGSYGDGDRDGDGDMEYVTRFNIGDVRPLITSVGGGPGSRCSFRLILSFTEPNPDDPPGIKADQIADIEILNTPE